MSMENQPKFGERKNNPVVPPTPPVEVEVDGQRVTSGT